MTATDTTPLARLLSSAQFQPILQYAKGIAQLNGQDCLDLHHFSLGAWAAQTAGLLDSHPVLVEHLRLYVPQLVKFLALSGVKRDGAGPLDREFPATEAFVQAADAANQADDPILSLVNAGLKVILNQVDRERIAVHEAGHAVISLVVRPEVRIAEATIAPSGDAGGFVRFDTQSIAIAHRASWEDVVDELCVGLAGRAAQVRAFGVDEADAGAFADMESATATAFQAVAMLGLDPEFGPVQLPVIAKLMSKVCETPINSGYLFDLAQRRTQALVKEAYAKTQQLVDKHGSAIERVSQLLLTQTTVSEAQIRAAIAAE